MSLEAVTSINLVSPHPMQRKIIAGRKRYNVLACGRRFGKTQLLQHLIIMEMLRGGSVGFFAPVHKDIAEVWRELYSTLEPIVIYKNESEKHMRIRGGAGKIGRLDLWGVNQRRDAGRGRDYSRVVYDEASLFRDLEHNWQQAVRPTLSRRQGDAWFAGTPKGFDPFKTLFDLGDPTHDTYDPKWQSWQLPTELNPYIPIDEIEQARHDLPYEIFAQEYLAQFNEKGGYLFKRDGLRFYAPDALPRAQYAEAMGLDFAYSSRRAGDWSVCITGRMVDGVIYVTDLLRVRSGIDEFMAAVASKRVATMGAFIGGQESGVLELANQNYGMHIIGYPASKDKFARALSTISLWNAGHIVLPAAADWLEEFLAELLGFSSELKDNRYDDQVDALVSLVEALQMATAPRNHSIVFRDARGW